MSTRKRSDEDLRRLSDRLLHDVQVFFHVSRSLVRANVGLRERSTWETETALVESFALHTRALVDFFFTRKRNDDRFPDDAYAIDFFASASQWHRLMPEQGRWLSSIRLKARKGVSENVDRFGEQLGHLNYSIEPVSDYARGWPTVQLTRDLGAVLYLFVRSVSDAKVSADFKVKARREIPLASKLRDRRQAMALWTPPATTQRLG